MVFRISERGATLPSPPSPSSFPSPLLILFILPEIKSSPNNPLFGNIWFMAIFSEITDKECVKNRYLALESEHSTCATFRGHLSNCRARTFCTRMSKLTAEKFVLSGIHEAGIRFLRARYRAHVDCCRHWHQTCTSSAQRRRRTHLLTERSRGSCMNPCSSPGYTSPSTYQYT